MNKCPWAVFFGFCPRPLPEGQHVLILQKSVFLTVQCSSSKLAQGSANHIKIMFNVLVAKGWCELKSTVSADGTISFVLLFYFRLSKPIWKDVYTLHIRSEISWKHMQCCDPNFVPITRFFRQKCPLFTRCLSGVFFIYFTLFFIWGFPYLWHRSTSFQVLRWCGQGTGFQEQCPCAQRSGSCDGQSALLCTFFSPFHLQRRGFQR